MHLLPLTQVPETGMKWPLLACFLKEQRKDPASTEVPILGVMNNPLERDGVHEKAAHARCVHPTPLSIVGLAVCIYTQWYNLPGSVLSRKAHGSCGHLFSWKDRPLRTIF